MYSLTITATPPTGYKFLSVRWINSWDYQGICICIDHGSRYRPGMGKLQSREHMQPIKLFILNFKCVFFFCSDKGSLCPTLTCLSTVSPFLRSVTCHLHAWLVFISRCDSGRSHLPLSGCLSRMLLQMWESMSAPSTLDIRRQGPGTTNQDVALAGEAASWRGSLISTDKDESQKPKVTILRRAEALKPLKTEVMTNTIKLLKAQHCRRVSK